MSSTEEKTLPEGWINKELGDICDVIGGGTPKTKVSEYWDGEVVWLSPIDLPPIGEISFVSDSRKKITDLGLQKSSAKLLPKGSVVYSTRASIGKIAIAEVPLSTNQGFTNFICNEQISNYFLCYALKHFNKNIEELSNSTTFKEVSKTAIKSFKIPLPPLEEQKRIVAKIDTLFAKIDKAISLTEESLKQAKNLLPSIIDETFDSFDAEKVDLKSVSDAIQYGYTGKTIENGKYYYLRITDIQGGMVNYQSTPYSDVDGIDIEKYRLNKGDILFARTGATAGKSYLFNDDVEAVFASYLIRVVCNQDIVKPSFVKWFFSFS
jgi:type I restriction enzyme S subunit